MKDISLLKFSRYFSLLYLGVTVLPLCLFFWWTSNHNHQLDVARHAQVSDMLAQSIGLQLASNLKRENEQLDHIGLLLHQDPKLALKDFPQLFGVDVAWWQKTGAVNSGAPSPTLNRCAQILESHNGLKGDYCLVGSNLGTIHRLSVGSKILYLSRSLPLDMIVPPGPHQTELFAGRSIVNAPHLAIYAPEPNNFPSHRSFRHGGGPDDAPRDFNRPHPPGFHDRHDMDEANDDGLPHFGGGPRRDENFNDRGPREHFPDGNHHRFEGWHPHPNDGPDHDGPPHFRPNDSGPFFGGGSPHSNEPMLTMGPDGHYIMPPLQPERKQILILTRSGQPVASIVLRLRQRPPHIDLWNAWLGGFLLFSGLLLSAVAGWYLKQNFIRPLAHLSLLSQDVRQGDLSGRLQTDGLRQREVLQTMTQFNAMLDELAEKETLRHNFISNLTHDFRTPLIAQTRAIELLLESDAAINLTPEQVVEYREKASLLKSLLSNNQHLLGMVNQLLETYQFESGKITIQKDYVNVVDLVDQCFTQLVSLANSRKITLEQSFPSDFPLALADKAYLSRVFINLVGNAIENIPKGSQIVVSGEIIHDATHGQQKWMHLHVRDNGPGLSASAIKHLFDRYGAGIEETETRKLGSGLGLYICKMFVEAHGGDIHADSIENEGSDFTIRLPWQEPV